MSDLCADGAGERVGWSAFLSPMTIFRHFLSDSDFFSLSKTTSEVIIYPKDVAEKEKKGSAKRWQFLRGNTN
jgi:hypothetical protein